MIEITEDKTGVTVAVRAQPKASANRIVGEYNASLKIAVTAPPEDGKANEAIVKLLSKKLKVAKSLVSIVSGETSRNKKVHIDGLTADKMKKILDRI